jgi:hypothetical protein
MRRLVTAGIIVLLIVLIWSGGWLALASWARGQIDTVLAQASERGVDVECADRDVVGFPFALRLDCVGTAVAERTSGVSAQLAGLTGGASIFAPRTASINLVSPAELRSPALAGPAEFSWADADIDVGMGLNGPRAVSFDAADIAAELPLDAFPQAGFAAQSATGTLAPAADGGTDAQFTFSALALSVADMAFPPFDGRGSAWISVPPRALLAGRGGLQAPISARIVDIRLSSGEARVQAQGDLAADAEGILDGTVTLRIAGAEALPAFIAALPPEYQQLGNAAAGGLLAFGTASTLDGEPASEITIEIVRGEAQVGPVEVTVPRLPL